jgi:hypothetical protein
MHGFSSDGKAPAALLSLVVVLTGAFGATPNRAQRSDSKHRLLTGWFLFLFGFGPRFGIDGSPCEVFAIRRRSSVWGRIIPLVLFNNGTFDPGPTVPNDRTMNDHT